MLEVSQKCTVIGSCHRVLLSKGTQRQVIEPHFSHWTTWKNILITLQLPLEGKSVDFNSRVEWGSHFYRLVFMVPACG